MFSEEVKKWYDLGNFLHYNNNRIFYHQDGDGDDLLIIHGYPFSSYQWKDFIAQLSKNYRVTIIDLLGFGFSDKPIEHKYSIEEYCYIINYTLKKLKINCTHLLCHDLGVNIGQELLLLSLEQKNFFKIQSLIFTNGPLFYQSQKLPLIQKLAFISPSFVSIIFSSIFNKKKIIAFEKLHFGPFTKPDENFLEKQWETLKFKNGKAVIFALGKLTYKRKKYAKEWIEAMNTTDIPFCFICGPFDRSSGRQMADYYLFAIKNPKVYLMEKYIGHYPHLEDPKSLIKNITFFLNSQNTILEKSILHYH